ncbi:hypothetical protein PG994_005122 [Apiospora phragmitis]|uniref:Uncharacterized protein n=1 Tax=Apiospora phragmitis TaxID=2905665 RepID=A0ABR1VWJ9_9PEZI
MHFSKLAITAIASTSAVYALPKTGPIGTDIQGKRAADEVGSGACNGDSCNYLLQNIKCTQGTSAKADGGGDGKRCDVHNFGDGKAYAICPGKA